MINFIVNTHSGKGKGKNTIKKLVDYCFDNNIEYSIHPTSAPTHATRIAKQLCETGFDTIVAVGGDGTFHEVLNGMDFEKAALGFIPSGTGNDYARAAKLSLDPIEALKDILKGDIINCDYFDVGTKRCLNVAGTGLDIDVLERVAGRTGKITYLLSLIYCLGHFKPYTVSITVGGETRTETCIMVAVCNGTCIGGNIKVSPISKLDDGKLDVIIMKMPEDGNLMKVLPKFTKGKHMDMPITTHIVCEEVSIDPIGRKINVDGELYSDVAFDCKIVKGGLKTFKSINFITNS